VFDVGVENSFDFLSAEYAELFGNSVATAFQHPLWLDRLYRRLVPSAAAEPLIVVVRSRGDGSLAMVLPLVRQRHGIMRVVEFADLRVSDYAAPVCDAPTFDRIARDQAACGQLRRALKPLDLLRVQKLREGAPALERLFGARGPSSMGMSAHAVALRGPFEEWRSEHIDRSYRKELDKKARQLWRKGNVRFACCDESGLIEQTFYSMREYRRPRFEGRGDGDLLQKPAYFDFYLDVALSGRGALARTYTLLMDQRPIAGVMALADRGRLLVILGGFDHAGFKNQSIGALMFEAIARDCIERGEKELDFTIGDEAYKRLFGSRPVPMFTITQAGSPLGSLASLAIEQVPWVKKVARRLMQKQRPKAVAVAPVTPPAEASHKA
jgi:CelD/BcsL family acetyltransferase involved in cellulose biosynthesis